MPCIEFIPRCFPSLKRPPELELDLKLESELELDLELIRFRIARIRIRNTRIIKGKFQQ